MVIEFIPCGVIPYKCENCDTLYLWKPMIQREFCRVRIDHPDCTIQECTYYKADPGEAQCPLCKLTLGQKRISSLRYKVWRVFSKNVAIEGD